MRRHLKESKCTVNNQNTEDNLTILLRILSIRIISSLLSTRDCATYAWTNIESTRVPTATSCWIFWQTTFRISRAVFNPHLPCGILFLRTREYWVPGVEMSQHQCITIRGIFWGVVIQQKRLIFCYFGDGCCYRFDLEGLARRSLEAESWEETRRERVN